MGIEIIEELVKKFAISKTNAAKILNRLSSNQDKNQVLFSSRPIKMKGNQFAYCYGESDKYAFWAITRTAKPALHSALERFKANKYIISKHELCKVGGCLLNGDEDTYGTLKNLLKDMSFFFDLVEIEIEGESFIIESAVRH